MTDKEKADQQASPKKTHLDDTSTSAQRARLLEKLHQGPVDTITARSVLNIMMPAARIKELREAGHPIKTHRLTLTDEHGRTHHGVALYYLGTLPMLEVAA
ncbi:helix-turn-helix domain-containing protein [Ectopseudomonas hydrolytica]|uniref:helix-turn-helix domain-containing protein n=1 Tax=Ectopseudomonas hydrolytica TaxID=2493633 RepID=UPI00376EDC97